MKLDDLPKDDQELVKELNMTSHQYEWHKKYNLERKSYWDCHGKAVPNTQQCKELQKLRE